jgi:hydroxyacylglutathione hydrolase
MLLERIYDESIAQAGYLIGCEETGTAVVVDPNRNITTYIDAAERRGLRIEIVTETHIHADFVSGARDLARATGAKLLLSAEGGEDWQYRFARSEGARLLRDGDSFDVGDVHVDVRHTPGHTPEHICFLITDRAVSDRPLGMLTGDFIFVGDVGRPDLLERAANVRGTMDAMARQLFRSLRATASLPDYLQIWPGHGAGSACGKSLGAVPSSTFGYERIANWAFQIPDENAFVREVLAGQPEPPTHFARMKAVNRDGPPAPPSRELPAIDFDGLKRAIASGASVIDVRSTADFAAGHIPRTLNIPTGTSFATWAGTLLPYDRDIVLLADGSDRIAAAQRTLAIIGHDRVVARGDRELREEWRSREGPLATIEYIDADALATTDREVIDVRGRAEWDDGHLPNATHIFLGDLAGRSNEIALDTPIAVHCHGGTRSAIAASVLQAKGFTNVVNVAGGVRAWEEAGLPLVSSESEEPVSS